VTQVQTHVSTCGKSGIVTGVLWAFQSPLPILIPPNAPISLTYHLALVQVCYQKAWLPRDSVSLQPKNKCEIWTMTICCIIMNMCTTVRMYHADHQNLVW
jgi:hypothetical protein